MTKQVNATLVAKLQLNYRISVIGSPLSLTEQSPTTEDKYKRPLKTGRRARDMKLLVPRPHMVAENQKEYLGCVIHPRRARGPGPKHGFLAQSPSSRKKSPTISCWKASEEYRQRTVGGPDTLL